METAANEPSSGALRVTGPQRVFVAPVLLALNVLWFVWMVAVHDVSPTNPASLDLLAYGADLGAPVVEGKWWRVLSAAFVHIGLIHIAVNMYALWFLGPAAERLYGNAAFLAIYLAGAIGCSLLALYVNPGTPSAGASGAIFALAGALLAFVVAHKDAMPKAAFRASLRSMGTFVLVNLIIGVMVPNISIAGHAGGFVTGFAAGWALDRDPARAPRLDLRRIARGALLAVVLAGASVLVVQRVRGDPRTWSALPLLHADEAYKAEQWQSVDEHTTAALAFEPDSKDALEMRAVARASLGRKQEALADCNALLALDAGTPNVRALYLRAEFEMGFGEFEAARADFEQLVKLERDNAKYQARLGVALLGSGEWAAAERALEGARRATEPADAEIELWIARQMTGQRENADEELRKYEFSARGTRAGEKTKFLLSVALGEEGERRGATSDELAQRVGVIRALRRVQTGNFDEARRLAQSVVDDDPRSWEASVARAIVAQLKR